MLILSRGAGEKIRIDYAGVWVDLMVDTGGLLRVVYGRPRPVHYSHDEIPGCFKEFQFRDLVKLVIAEMVVWVSVHKELSTYGTFKVSVSAPRCVQVHRHNVRNHTPKKSA